MASFISKILSLFTAPGTTSDAAAPAGKTETYADCLIRATPKKEGAQFRLAGLIEKPVGDAKRTRSFIRADLFSSEQDAIDAAFRKAHQIIDQHGPSLFADEAETRAV